MHEHIKSVKVLTGGIMKIMKCSGPSFQVTHVTENDSDLTDA